MMWKICQLSETLLSVPSSRVVCLPIHNSIDINLTKSIVYKNGIIRSRDDHFQGQATAGKEPGRDKYDLFIDWRQNISTITMGPEIKDPHKVCSFKTTAFNFAAKNPSARFAVLTMWSEPYFYPLMIGYQNRNGTSFRDLVGRTYNFMFVPKDMPCSEWSIHHTASMRLQPWAKFFKDRVVVKRDKYLVMGADEKELFRLASAVTFAIQMRPWRLEVDLWKSFVNVDAKFLGRLDDKWLE